MKAILGAVASTAFLILAGCGASDDTDSPGAAAPDVSSETTPAPLPLPPETEPLNPDSGLAPAPLPADTAA